MAVTNPSPGGGYPGDARRPDSIGGLRRDHPFARRVALQWRRLTGSAEAKTLIACSGGADSTALLLAMALATRQIVVAHIVHDLRPRAEAEADRDAVRQLAHRLNLPVVEAEVQVSDRPGNKESLARRERYAALARLAGETGCPFLATAHHADDQLETLLMALLRGSGPHGLRGIAPRRSLTSTAAHAPTLIRPMLRVTRAEARDACALARIPWREDATNRDTTRLRAALRTMIIPAVTALRPESPRRATQAAELLRDAAAIIDERVDATFAEGLDWSRADLRRQSTLIVGAGLRRTAARLLQGRHTDRLTSRLIDKTVRAIRDHSTDPREFHWPGGIRVRVTAGRITMSKT